MNGKSHVLARASVWKKRITAGYRRYWLNRQKRPKKRHPRKKCMENVYADNILVDSKDSHYICRQVIYCCSIASSLHLLGGKCAVTKRRFHWLFIKTISKLHASRMSDERSAALIRKNVKNHIHLFYYRVAAVRPFLSTKQKWTNLECERKWAFYHI